MTVAARHGTRSRFVRAAGAVVVSAASEHRRDGAGPGNTPLTWQVVDVSGARRAFEVLVQLFATGPRNTGPVSIYKVTPHS
jgi:hypothetical protein